MHHEPLASRLTAALSLDTTPIAVSFVQSAPDNIPASKTVVPSSCAFWREAEHATFYAPAEAHFRCPIGAMVMGFDLPESVGDELGELMTKMSDCGYLDPAEAANLPTQQERPIGIVYGPLGEHPMAPNVALLWLSPRQAMVCNEAIGAANWSQAGPQLTGRPACAALPLTINSGLPVTSYGCAGMRTFTGIGDDRMLFATPGTRLTELTAAVVAAAEINHTMDGFYQDRKAALVEAVST